MMSGDVNLCRKNLILPFQLVFRHVMLKTVQKCIGLWDFQHVKKGRWKNFHDVGGGSRLQTT